MIRKVFIILLALLMTTMFTASAQDCESHYNAALSPTLDADGNPALDIFIITAEGDIEHFITATAELLSTANDDLSIDTTFTGDFNGASVYVIEANTLQLTIGSDKTDRTYYYYFDICSGEIIDAYTIEP